MDWKINTIKTAILTNAIHKFNAKSHQNPNWHLSQKQNQRNPQICMEPSKTMNSQSNSETKEQSQTSNYTTKL